MVKTGQDHINAVRDGRQIYLDGKVITDATEHPAYRNAIKSAAMLYDYQAAPENIERMTFDLGDGHRVNRAWQLPRSYAELVERRKALTEWSELTGGFLGRDPAHVASSMCGQFMGAEIFDEHSPARGKAFRDWFHEARRNDVFMTYVINNVQGDRSKAYGDQGPGAEDMVARIVDEDSEGITIRGAKLFATSAIMANEIFVGTGQPLKPGEEHLAFSCALPMDAKGIKLLSRKSYEQHAGSEFDYPLSTNFDENDALVFFDDVKVPWERVFVHRDTAMCRKQLHNTPAHVYANYQSEIRIAVKLRFLVGLARGIAEVINTITVPAVAETLGRLAAQAATIEGLVWGMEAKGRNVNGYYIPDAHLLYAAQVQSQEIYPEVIATIRELAGGALLMLPSSVEDFTNSDIETLIKHTQISPAVSSLDRIKLFKLIWDAVGSEFASRHVQYEMFYSGPKFVTRGNSFRTYDWDRAKATPNKLLSSYSLEGSLKGR
ncbi:4-hydroxyphenylacetate 3-monooxygenase [Falsochrobactrum shanghaiense]|uniref:4-hydroxyphenylacetate 3-monooxygenase n=2 Tax=Falsochrobactrum shanghaiense TaxID=2201899 RepID=A0A316JM72_9HYPH|nr:4-hydroxyphenylacetate 3-monooxygenase [Falsochrobactrum shanghaiense]